MKKWFTLGAIFLTSYFIFLLSTLPLPWVMNKITLPKNIVFNGVSGTVWQGNIEQVLIINAANRTEVQQVKTALSFWSLLSFSPKVDVVFGDALLAGPEGKLSVAVSQEQVALTDVVLIMPANDVAQQAKLPLPVTAKGEFELQMAQIIFSLSEQTCQQASGNLNWSGAGVIAMKETIKLGQLKADISCEKGDVIAKISPQNNLGLSFSANINIKDSMQRNRLTVSGKGYLKPPASFPEQLQAALPFLGRPDKDGRYRLAF